MMATWETGSLGAITLGVCYGNVLSDPSSHDMIGIWIEQCHLEGSPFLCGGDFNWDGKAAESQLCFHEREMQLLDFGYTCFGSGSPSAIDWIVGSRKLVGSLKSWSRVLTSLATHRALLVRLPGREAVSLNTLVTHARPMHVQLAGPSVCSA